MNALLEERDRLALELDTARAELRNLRAVRDELAHAFTGPTDEETADAVRAVEDTIDAHLTPCAGCAALGDGVAIGPAAVARLVEDGWRRVIR